MAEYKVDISELVKLEEKLKVKENQIKKLFSELDKTYSRIELLQKENKKLLGMLYEANEQFLKEEQKTFKERYYEAFGKVLS